MRRQVNTSSITDSVEREQAPALQLMLIGLTIAACLWFPLPFFTAVTTIGRVFGIAGALLVISSSLCALWLLRRGLFRGAVLMAVAGLIVAIALLLIAWGLRGGTMMLLPFAIAITLTGLLGGRRALFGSALISCVIVVVVAILEHLSPPLAGFAPFIGDLAPLTVGTFVLVIGVVVFLFERFGATFRESLETTVVERTSALQAALETVAQRERRLVEALNELQASQATVQALSAPIIPVLPGVLVAPLIGTIDSARAALFTEKVLQAVAQRRVEHVIFDITGVAIVDTQIAQVLLRTAAAAQLLGVHVVLVGIRADVAQTLVALNIHMNTIDIYANLQEAITVLI